MKIKSVLRSAWMQMRRQPLLSVISIIGTALSIFLIMIVVMMQQVQTAPFAPESGRDRFLHYRMLSSVSESFPDGWSTNGPMSYETAKQTLLGLTSPEAVTAYQAFLESSSVSLPLGEMVRVDLRPVDDNFWKVFDFTFVDGKPFTLADFDAGLPAAVITESVARKLFGSTEVAGKEFLINLAPFRVAGVVKDVSTLASSSYAEVWPNLSATTTIDVTWADIHGLISVTILARDRSDFPKIREEQSQASDRFDDMLKEGGRKIISRGRPYDQETQSVTFYANEDPDVADERINRLMVYLILLLVPAINLSSMTQSRLKQRVAEIGVRRTFGCTRKRIIIDIMLENLAITLFAGLLGLVMSVVFGFLCNGLLFTPEGGETLNAPLVDTSILLHWSTFGWAMLFCFILNILSSGLPAIHASRIKPVEALNGRK